MNKTAISWTDFTWTVSRGCSPISAGCKNCYAAKMATRFAGPGGLYEGLAERGHWTGNIRLCPENLEQPIARKKPAKIFINSMSDLFHADVPFDFIDDVFHVIQVTPRHIFQILTKRPDRMKKYLYTRYMFPINLWAGVSVENQDNIDRIEILSDCHYIRFVSLEPMIGPIDLSPYLFALHWVILGCESGPGARPFNPDWARSIRDQCKDHGIPFFYKQGPDETTEKVVSMPTLDGQIWDQYPKGKNG